MLVGFGFASILFLATSAIPTHVSACQVHDLRSEGDFVTWPSGVYHLWESPEDSLVITVRWPSKPTSD